jgi:hypothetical protein
MKSDAIAQIRIPTDEELNELRNLWIALGQQKLPTSTSLGDELQTYLRHAAFMVGMVAGLKTLTNEVAWENESPISVSTHGVARLRDSARLWHRILPLWTSMEGARGEEQSR